MDAVAALLNLLRMVADATGLSSGGLGLVGLLLVVCVGLAWGWRRSAQRVGRANSLRGERARWGEQRAERLLQRKGYRIVGRQVQGHGHILVDGEALDIRVRVDLIVKRRGRRFVAEVKTGTTAPDPTHPATRRQLREYAALFPDHGLLLVDAEAGTVHRVEF
jgi:Holliday junction resolvase-like predicted endonuclease